MPYKKGAFTVSKKKLNERFINAFVELDKLCCEKFGIISGGVTEYINRLNNARFAPNRDVVLPKLVKYRNLRNRFAHEPASIRKSTDIAKEDIKWVRKFRKSVRRKKDPLSKYLRKARRFARRKKLKKVIIALVILAIIAGGAAAAFLFLV